MGAIASQITSLTIVYSTVYSRYRSKETWKLRVTGLCEGNLPGTGDFPAQMANNAENVSIWWRHDEKSIPDHCSERQRGDIYTMYTLPVGAQPTVARFTHTNFQISWPWVIYIYLYIIYGENTFVSTIFLYLWTSLAIILEFDMYAKKVAWVTIMKPGILQIYFSHLLTIAT